MKKSSIFFILLLLSLSSGLNSYGKGVDENTAKAIGSNYIVSNGIPGVKSSNDLTIAHKATAMVNGQSVVDFYVFNFNNNEGFVMVSGDDAVTPILAYSSESLFDLSNMAPATKAWVEGYQNQITYVLQNNVPAKVGTAEKWNALKVAAAAPATGNERTTITFPSSTSWLCNTKWDQDPGYDLYCPTAGGQTVTGCVPTAMAQVMKFWNWPTVGTGSHSYNAGTYGVLSADFGKTAYNWSEMSSFLTSSCRATDSLMFQAGVAIEAQYGTAASGGTGAWVTESETYSSAWPLTVTCAEYALKTYFHYKRTLHGEIRLGFTSDIYNAFRIPAQPGFAETAWIAMLEAELNLGRPMLYKGNEASGGGHCWVCDGYNSSNLFHFNWGWSGASNGFYTVDNLAPPALGAGGGSGNFNNDQGVVLGIEPDAYASIPTGNIQLASHVDCANNSPMSYFTGFSVVATITNTGSATFRGSFCAQVFDTLNNLVGTMQVLPSQVLNAGATSAALTFTTPGFLNMIPGQYYIEVLFQPTGSTTWSPVANNGSYINYNMVDVRSSNEIELYAPINVTTGTTMLSDAGGMTLTTQVANFTSGNFNGTISAVLQNVNTLAQFTVQSYASQSISSGFFNSYTFTNSSLHVPPGLYVLAVRHQPAGGSVYITGSDYYENPVLITVNKNLGVTTQVSADNISVYPNPANDVINVATGGAAISSIRVTDIQGREMIKMTPDNQSVISVPVSNLAAGLYLVQLQTGENVITKKIVIAK